MFHASPGIDQLDYATTPAALDFTGDFTFSIWANRENNGAADNTWWSYALLDNGQVGLRATSSGAYPTPAYPTLFLFDGGTLLGSVHDTTFDFRAAANTGVWVHVVAYRRGDRLGIVTNGHEVTARVTGTVGASNTFWLAQGSDGYNWQGTIDEVGKWNRALSAAEIAALYNSGSGFSLP